MRNLFHLVACPRTCQSIKEILPPGIVALPKLVARSIPMKNTEGWTRDIVACLLFSIVDSASVFTLARAITHNGTETISCTS
jgi:hypothetical protein